MKIIVARNPKSYDECDVLFRVYENQSGESPKDQYFAFEVMTKIGTGGSYNSGRYSSEHPQAVRDMAHKVLKEFEDTDYIVMLSNEWEDYTANQYVLWFDDAFNKASAKYKAQ